MIDDAVKSPAQGNAQKGVDTIPTGLMAQFRRHARPYIFGTLLLALSQGLAYCFNRGLEAGGNAVAAGKTRDAITTGALIAVIPLISFGIRVLSRVLIFNGGRDV